MCFFKKDNLLKQNERPLKCPRCDKNMDKIKKEDVIIDVCPRCKGMWLDDKEVDKILQMREEIKNGKSRRKKK